MAMRGTITAYLLGPLTNKETLVLILQEICISSQGNLWYGNLSLAFDSLLYSALYNSYVSIVFLPLLTCK